LPEGIAKHLAWLKGDQTIDAWLLLIKPGRYRLLSAGDVGKSDSLHELAERINNPENDDASREPFEAESDEVAALVLRLIPTHLSPKGPGWRLTLPRNSPLLGNLDDGVRVTLLFSEGYLELWMADFRDKALSIPLDKLLG
jgi:hypothetical protein